MSIQILKDGNIMSNYIEHAQDEFLAAGWINHDGSYNDEMQKMICEDIIKLLDVFGEQGHSGSSASYTLNLFEKLANFKPIAPITGEDWEWVDVADGKGGILYQNRRCSSIFKDSTGCWDIDGKVFWEWNVRENGSPYKSYYHGGGCSTPVTFPYTPGKRIEEYRYSDATPTAPPQTEEGIL